MYLPITTVEIIPESEIITPAAAITLYERALAQVSQPAISYTIWGKRAERGPRAEDQPFPTKAEKRDNRAGDEAIIVVSSRSSPPPPAKAQLVRSKARTQVDLYTIVLSPELRKRERERVESGQPMGRGGASARRKPKAAAPSRSRQSRHQTVACVDRIRKYRIRGGRAAAVLPLRVSCTLARRSFSFSAFNQSTPVARTPRSHSRGLHTYTAERRTRPPRRGRKDVRQSPRSLPPPGPRHRLRWVSDFSRLSYIYLYNTANVRTHLACAARESTYPRALCALQHDVDDYDARYASTPRCYGNRLLVLYLTLAAHKFIHLRLLNHNIFFVRSYSTIGWLADILGIYPWVYAYALQAARARHAWTTLLHTCAPVYKLEVCVCTTRCTFTFHFTVTISFGALQSATSSAYTNTTLIGLFILPMASPH